MYVTQDTFVRSSLAGRLRGTSTFGILVVSVVFHSRFAMVNKKAIALMEQGGATPVVPRVGNVNAKPVYRVETVHTTTHRMQVGSYNMKTRVFLACLGLVLLGLVGGGVWLALLNKDPTVSFEDFELTKFNPTYTFGYPTGLTLGYDTRLIIDNSDGFLEVTVAPATIELYYREEKKIDEDEWKGVVIPAKGSVPTVISHEKAWGLTDLPLLGTLLVDWAATGKDLEFHVKTNLDVSAFLYKRTFKIDCKAVIKGRTLTEKPTMTCTRE